MIRLRQNPLRRLVICLTLVLTLSSAACSAGKDSAGSGVGDGFRFRSANPKGSLITMADRKPAGPVAGNLLAGGRYALSQDVGKIVVLNFFASWCGPCQNETPQFDSVYRERKASGVQFVGLDVKDPSVSQSKSFMTEKSITFPVIYDEPAKTALQLGDVPINTLPQTVLVDRHGRVAAVYFAVLLPKDLKNALDLLAAEG